MELLCSVKNYDWGHLSHESIVARIASKNDPLFVINDDTPYAEYWMGTHPNGQSIIKLNGLKLKQYIDKNPTCLGNSQEIFGNELPFLFKILSVKKALSIQVHPNKEFAKELNKKYPKLYSDDNHKPELAVALTEFEALCGFRPLDQIADFLRSIPELCGLIDPEYVFQFKKKPSVKFLEKCFESYISKSPIEARKCTAQLIERLLDANSKTRELQLANLFFRLNEQFPGDIGLFAIYFFNHIVLQPGEAVFIGAGFPHAYLAGDCAEVMARSDNVIRAGLTPKVRDVATLLKAIECHPVGPEDMKFKSTIFNDQITIYAPPIQDFALRRIVVSTDETYTIPVLKSASIVLILRGFAEHPDFTIQTGSTLFFPANYSATFKPLAEIEMYQAYTNVL